MKRVLAIIGIAVLLGMIVATLICALAGAPANVLSALIYCDIIIPIMIWLFLWVAKLLKDRNGGKND